MKGKRNTFASLAFVVASLLAACGPVSAEKLYKCVTPGSTLGDLNAGNSETYDPLKGLSKAEIQKIYRYAQECRFTAGQGMLIDPSRKVVIFTSKADGQLVAISPNDLLVYSIGGTQNSLGFTINGLNTEGDITSSNIGYVVGASYYDGNSFGINQQIQIPGIGQENLTNYNIHAALSGDPRNPQIEIEFTGDAFVVEQETTVSGEGQ